jgi:hypothetical protein
VSSSSCIFTSRPPVFTSTLSAASPTCAENGSRGAFCQFSGAFVSVSTPSPHLLTQGLRLPGQRGELCGHLSVQLLPRGRDCGRQALFGSLQLGVQLQQALALQKGRSGAFASVERARVVSVEQCLAHCLGPQRALRSCHLLLLDRGLFPQIALQRLTPSAQLPCQRLAGLCRCPTQSERGAFVSCAGRFCQLGMAVLSVVRGDRHQSGPWPRAPRPARRGLVSRHPHAAARARHASQTGTARTDRCEEHR